LGLSVDATAPPRWLAEALSTLAEAERLEPRAAVAAPEIRARLTALAAPGEAETAGGTVGTAAPRAARLTRVHGDLHFAQFLRTADRTLIVDLEGDPTAPLARRRRPDTPLRDLAALLRSIDHIGTAASRRAERTDPQPFVAAASAATLDAYNNATGTPADLPLLAALELASELRELVYAHRVVPEWAYAPQAGLDRLLQRPGTTP
jgi:predicted trehalose synthase